MLFDNVVQFAQPWDDGLRRIRSTDQVVGILPVYLPMYRSAGEELNHSHADHSSDNEHHSLGQASSKVIPMVEV